MNRSMNGPWDTCHLIDKLPEFRSLTAAVSTDNMFRAAHMYAFVYLSGLLSMDAIYDLPILLKDCGVAINDPECTRLLVDAHVHYEYSMPHVVASHIIPCCVLVALSGTISNAFTRRSGLSLFVLLMTVV